MRSEKLSRAHAFLRDHVGTPFSAENIAEATGWTVSTVRTYLSKQWESFVSKTVEGYMVEPGFLEYPLDVFLRMNSQKFMVNKDPFKPVLSLRTEELVTKSRESALLAVQVYNNPMLQFRTPSFIVHMVIAFTALFHAIFEEDRIDYRYHDDRGTVVKSDGEAKLWDITQCINTYWDGKTTAARKNVEFFVCLRNAVEHRFSPPLDYMIAGECQALLNNYEALLAEHFTRYYAIGTQIAVPIQISHTTPTAKIDALRELQKTDTIFISQFVQSLREGLSDEILGSMEYAFRVYLVPKPANRVSSSDVSMEFVNAGESEIASLQKGIVLIKNKQVQVANQGKYRPKDVVARVQEVEPRFRVHDHTQAWRYWGIRPRKPSPIGCDSEYCQYDAAHHDIVYTDRWVERLTKLVQDPSEWIKVQQYRDNKEPRETKVDPAVKTVF